MRRFAPRAEAGGFQAREVGQPGLEDLRKVGGSTGGCESRERRRPAQGPKAQGTGRGRRPIASSSSGGRGGGRDAQGDPGPGRRV